MPPHARTHDAPNDADRLTGKPHTPVTAMTVQRSVNAGALRLARAGIDTAALDARLIVAHALGLSLEDLVRDGLEKIASDQQEGIDACLARRLAREPIAYITGEKEFWSVDFAVTRNTLIPRPESEILVAEALSLLTLDGDGARGCEASSILDLGTGSGCLLLSVLNENRQARGVGVDIDREALDIARLNAKRCGLGSRATFVRSDWGANIRGRFNLVITNPPYICSAELERLAPEVCHYEPRGALDGGADGLDCYRRIAGQLSRLLVPGGFVVVEIGSAQAEEVKEILFDQAPLSFVELRRDLAKMPRCVIGRYLG